MISRMVEVRNELSQVLEELNWNNLPNRDWKVLESMMCLLEPFAQYTSLTSGDEYTTFSTVVPVLMELDYHLEAMKEKPGLREIASLLQKELSDRFQNVLVPTSFNFDPIFVAATALDRRYRVLLNEEQLRHAKIHIMRELSGIEESEDVPGSIPPVTSDVEGEEENPESEPPFKRFRYLPSILSEKRKEQAHSRSTSLLMTLQQEELDKYLSTTVQVDERLDPIQFWISSEQTYPHIAPLACDLLTIPASSAPVERTFSTAGEVASGKRNRLSDKSLEREVLIKKNKCYL